MAINQATLKSIRDWLIIKMKDNSSYERFTKAMYDSAINMAISDIVGDTEFYERTVGVKTDSERLFFNLRGSNPEDIADDYLSMQKVIIDGKEIKSSESQDIWRDSVLTPYIADPYDSTRYSNPFYYIQDEKLNFGTAITASVETIDDTEDRNFTTTTGNWTATNGAISSAAGGYSGNGMKYVKDAVAAAYSQTLASDYIDALVVGKYYVVSFWAKYVTNWDGGVVTVTCGNYSTTFTPTASYQRVTLRFRADATSTSIVLTSASIPTNLDELWLDSFTFSKCVLVVNYHAVPELLVEDSDTPPSPLHLYPNLCFNMAIIALNTLSPVEVGIIDKAMLALYGLDGRSGAYGTFKRAISSKGRGQQHVKHPTYF